MINLTELEKRVMGAARATDFGDCLVEPQWSFAVCDASGLSEKTYLGVVSSLVKKGLVRISDQEGLGRSRDMVFEYTDTGNEYIRMVEKDDALRDAVVRVLALAEESHAKTCGKILLEEERKEVRKDGNAIKLVRRELGLITVNQGANSQVMGKTEMVSRLEYLMNCIRDILDKGANNSTGIDSTYVSGNITTKAISGLDDVIEALNDVRHIPSARGRVKPDDRRFLDKKVSCSRIQGINR